MAKQYSLCTIIVPTSHSQKFMTIIGHRSVPIATVSLEPMVLLLPKSSSGVLLVAMQQHNNTQSKAMQV